MSGERDNDFKNIKNVSELIGFLKDKGSNHDYFYHYTNTDGLRGMLNSRKMFLSKGQKMNDKQELTKGKGEIWNRLYISSFAFGGKENMAMWGLYGVPREEAIRITIPGKVMREWISETERVYTVERGNKGFEYKECNVEFEMHLSDVIYASGERGDSIFKIYRDERSKEIWRGKSDIGKISTDERMTGYVKNHAWKYENEVRMRIELSDSSTSDRIAIDIPEYVFGTMTLMFGPGYKSTKGFGDIELNTVESAFQSLVEYRDKCSFCRHEYKR